ncbi:GTP-binding protein 10-like isoform X2 [Lampetra planeri]
MVRGVSALLLQAAGKTPRHRHFVDSLRLHVRGGTGGMGLPRLGGEGGPGGDVWVLARPGASLRHVTDRQPSKRLAAGVGDNSSVRCLKGAKGKDFQIEVPLGISVHTDDGTLIGEVNSPEDRVRVAVGGLGGGLTTDYQPSPGQRRMIRLDLKLIADVGLIGFPNAGKSTLLEKLSSAKPKIADYPFTTLCPQLGKMMFQDHRQISVADLPGLIEGAHANKGMGHHFLKHVQRNKILLFVVDVFGFRLSPKTHFRDAFQTVQLLVKELELYGPDLLGKAAVLAVNKMDLPGAQEKYKQLCHQLMHPQDFLSLLPAGMVPVESFPFEHVLPVAAVRGTGVEELKIAVRKVLDEQQVEAVMKVREEMGFIRVAGVGETDVARVLSH